MKFPSLAERSAPGLSETLTGAKSPDTCQSCSQIDQPSALERWRECDEWDKPTEAIIILCSTCSKRLIDKHARLYHRLQNLMPVPGLMQLCTDCIERDGTRCKSSLAKFNGGSGLAILYPKPDEAFLCPGGYTRFYKGEATLCSGRIER